MGPGVKRNAQGSSLARQDAEVTRLRQELQLCNMRLSQLQARLMVTLDELDASRTAHEREIKTERRAKEKLSEKLDRYLDEVKRAEGERDEMREVVSILVEKVERCNDYSAWPYSRMSLARPLELLASGNDRKPVLDTNQEAINKALLESIQRQLIEERRSHARTKEEAGAEISRLRAMVARRDAELEACTTHSGHRVWLSSFLPTEMQPLSSCTHGCSRGCRHGEDLSAGPSSQSRAKPTEVEHEAVLSQTVARQRTLEREVAYLQEQLEHERHRRSQATLVPTNHSNLAEASHAADQQPARPIHIAKHPVTPHAKVRKPPSPQLRPRVILSSPSHYDLGSDNGTRRSPLRQSAAAPQLSASEPLVSTDPAGTSTSLSLGDLKHEIDMLSTQIAAFTTERAALERMLAEALPQERRQTHQAENQPAPAHPTAEGMASTVRHEECLRETRELRQQLEELRRERAERETALQSELDVLREALSRSRTEQRDGELTPPTGDLAIPSSRAPPHSPSPLRVPDRPDSTDTVLGGAGTPEGGLDEKENGDDIQEDVPLVGSPKEGSEELEEQSMELATPLQHRTILSLAEDSWPTPLYAQGMAGTSESMVVEPFEVPLPISPDAQSPGHSIDPDVPLISFSPPPAPPPAYPHTSTPPPGKSPLPPLYVAEPPQGVPSDLLARVESLSEARIDAIGREFQEKARELEEKTRQLEAKAAEVEDLRKTTMRLHDQSSAREPRDAGASGATPGALGGEVHDDALSTGRVA